jgi:hypothetical protein
MTRDPEKAKEKMDDLYKDRAYERATLKVPPQLSLVTRPNSLWNTFSIVAPASGPSTSSSSPARTQS